jgi:hypothetical protein
MRRNTAITSDASNVLVLQQAERSSERILDRAGAKARPARRAVAAFAAMRKIEPGPQCRVQDRFSDLDAELLLGRQQHYA